MQQSHIMEDKVLSAVRVFASSISSGSKIVADMSALIDATAELPPENFAYWERLIRYEFDRFFTDVIP